MTTKTISITPTYHVMASPSSPTYLIMRSTPGQGTLVGRYQTMEMATQALDKFNALAEHETVTVEVNLSRHF